MGPSLQIHTALMTQEAGAQSDQRSMGTEEATLGICDTAKHPKPFVGGGRFLGSEGLDMKYIYYFTVEMLSCSKLLQMHPYYKF